MGPAHGRAPARGPWGFRHHGTSRRQTPTSAHARCRAGNGEERGGPYALATLPSSRSRAPSKPHGLRRASVRGPWSAIAVARCPLAGGHTAPLDPAPAPWVTVVRAGWHAQAHGLGRGHVRAHWPEGPRPCLVRGHWLACPGPRPGSRLCPARGTRTGEARLRMGGEGKCAQTGDSNAGCNYPVRGYSPSMHFSGEVTCPVILLPSIFGGPERGAALLASLCSPFSGVFQFLDRYISLARNIGYVTIKPMTKYCQVFMLSLADKREIAALPAITVLRFEKNRSSGNVQKGQNFGLALNIGPAFSDGFQVLTAI